MSKHEDLGRQFVDAISNAMNRPTWAWDFKGYDYGSEKRSTLANLIVQVKEGTLENAKELTKFALHDDSAKKKLNALLVVRVVYIAPDGGTFNINLRGNDKTNSPFLARRVMSRIHGLKNPVDYGHTWVTRAKFMWDNGEEQNPETLRPFIEYYDTKALGIYRGDIDPQDVMNNFHAWVRGVNA